MTSFVGAVWAAALIQKNAPGASGKWAVAPLPQWTAGAKASGNRGGSATAVLKGCKNPKEATEAALAMSTNNDIVTSLIQNTGIYPAAISGQELPAVNQPSEYFGGQNIYPIFKEAAANIAPGWVWGPTMTQVQPAFKDGLKKVGSGQGTIPQLVTTVQTSTVNDHEGSGAERLQLTRPSTERKERSSHDDNQRAARAAADRRGHRPDGPGVRVRPATPGPHGSF